MKGIDVVIVSNSKNEYLRSLTQQTIDTAKNNESKVSVNITVVEFQDYNFFNAETIRQEGEFCYNKFLNQGAELGKSEYIAFCNNDLIFGNDWATNIISEMEENNVSSACPYCPESNYMNKTGIEKNSGVYFGYEVRKEFVGWIFVWKRKLWERLKLDEQIKFWASDNSCAKVLQLNNEKHILVTSSIVKHVWNGSNTLNTVPPNERYDLMHRQIKRFNKLYKENYFGLGEE